MWSSPVGSVAGDDAGSEGAVFRRSTDSLESLGSSPFAFGLNLSRVRRLSDVSNDFDTNFDGAHDVSQLVRSPSDAAGRRSTDRAISPAPSDANSSHNFSALLRSDDSIAADSEVATTAEAPAPAGDSEEPLSQVDQLETAIAYNEALEETLDALALQVKTAIDEVHRIREEAKKKVASLKSEEGDGRRKRKVPMQMFVNPYFKDCSGMVPPLNEEAKRKIEAGEYDPLVREEKRWTRKELEILRVAVRQSLVESRVVLIKQKRDDVAQKIKLSGQTTSPSELEAWREEIESYSRLIRFEENKRDEDVFKGGYDHVDWAKIANTDFKGSRSVAQVRQKWLMEECPKWSKKPWTDAELNELRTLTKDTQLSWTLVANMLGTRRTPYQCFEKYKTEIEETGSRKPWTRDEDKNLIVLTAAAKINGTIQWEKVTPSIPNRTRQQCQLRYGRVLSGELKHGRWTEEEDVMLKVAVERFGTHNWVDVSPCVPGRSPSQCRERWVNALDQNINDGPWTTEEDRKLLEGITGFGKGWSDISKLLPGRSPDHCKARFRSLVSSKIKLANRVAMDFPLGARRYDTTKFRRERREQTERVFKDLLGADGEDEVAEELWNEQVKSSTLTEEDEKELLSQLPPEKRHFVETRMKEVDAQVGAAAPSLTLQQILGENFQLKPEFLDVSTRRLLIGCVQRANRRRATAKRHAGFAHDSACRSTFLKINSLATEEEQKFVLMDEMCRLVEKGDEHYDSLQRVIQSKSGVTQSITSLLRQTVEEPLMPRSSSEGSRDYDFTPLPPCLATLSLYEAIKAALPRLRNSAAELYPRVDQGCDDVLVMLSEKLTGNKEFKVFSRLVKTLFFYPMLLDSAIEVEENAELRERVREVAQQKIRARLKKKRAKMRNWMLYGSDRTLRSSSEDDSGNAADPHVDVNFAEMDLTDCDGLCVRDLVYARSRAAIRKKRKQSDLEEANKADISASIDEAIEAVRGRVADIFRREFNEPSKKRARTAENELADEVIDNVESDILGSLPSGPGSADRRGVSADEPSCSGVTILRDADDAADHKMDTKSHFDAMVQSAGESSDADRSGEQNTGPLADDDERDSEAARDLGEKGTKGTQKNSKRKREPRKRKTRTMGGGKRK